MNDLSAIARYLNDIRSACETDGAALANRPNLVGELDAIERAAAGMLGDFVLRFGVIGDSNAGKSRLIGGLIGRADALPVNPIPFTGNIAILRIRSDATLSSAELGPYHLRFISAPAARDCMAHLLATFLQELEEMTGTADLVRAGRELERQLAAAAKFEPALGPWLTTAWHAVADRGVNVRMRLTELGRFMVTWHRLGDAVGGKEQVVVSREVAEAAMVLPKQVEASTFAEFVKAVNESINGATRVPGRLSAMPSVITKAFAEVCYPLVHDIRIAVRVPESVWNLTRLHVDAIELFDFPGLAAQGTAARDAFLSLRERRENRIHTWVIVVNSAELKGSQATEIVKELPADRVVAVANRFDALPLWTDGHIEELDRMIDPHAPPVRQRDVLLRLTLLPPLTSIFERLTRPDRCVLVSAMLGLTELDQLPAVRNRVLSDQQRKNWHHDVSKGRDVQPKWSVLAQKIRAVEANAPLAAWLSSYAQRDGQGGLGRLRQILFEHANAVGLVQLTEEMNDRVAELDVAIQAFLARASQHVEESLAKANEVRARLDQLLTVYSDHADPPSSIEGIRVRPTGPTTNGRLNPQTRLLAPPATAPRPLADFACEETLMRVWDWGVWKALLDAGRDDGFVEGSQAIAGAEVKDLPPWDDAVTAAPPVRAGELHGPFCSAYAEVEAIAVAALRSSLLDFLTGLSSRLAPLAADLGALAQNNPKNVVNFALKPTVEQTVKRFLHTVVADAPLDRPTDAFWRDRFPFLTHADEHGCLTAGPCFGWSPERRDVVRNKTEHQMYVLRLRTELTTAIEAGVTRHVAAALGGFRNRFNEMRQTLANSIDQLKGMSNANLLALFGKAALSPRDETPLALRTISERLKT